MKKILVLSVLFLMPLLNANAQQIASGRLISLGGLSTAVSTDVDAIGTNPANLVALSRGNVVIELAPVGITAGSDFFTLGLYNDYFTGQTGNAGSTIGTYLTESDKQKIIDAFPNGAGNVRVNANIRALGIAIRGLDYGIGFSVDDKVGTQATIPSSLASLALDGFTWGSLSSWNDLASKSFWYRSYNVDYAMRLPSGMLLIPKQIAKDFEVGIGFKFVTGFSYSSIQSTNTSIYADSTNHSYVVNMGFDAMRAGLVSNIISKAAKSTVGDTVVNFNPFKPQGTGFGIDLGATAKVINLIKVGVSLTDIGSLAWSKNLVRTTGDTTITFAGLSPAQSNVTGSKSNLDSLRDAFKDYFKNKDTTASSFSTPLPTRLNVGASINLEDLFPSIPGELLVAVDYHQGFNDAYDNSTVPEFVFGAEWNPIDVLPIRTGIGLGGLYGFRWSFGFGLDLPFWDLDLGIGTFNTIVAPSSAKNVSIVLSILKFRF